VKLISHPKYAEGFLVLIRQPDEIECQRLCSSDLCKS